MKRLKQITTLIAVFVMGMGPVAAMRTAHADTLGAMTSYNLASTSPTRLVEGIDGSIWVNGSIYNANTWHTDYYAYKVNRATGAYTTYASYPNTTDIAIGPDDNLWAIDSFHVTKVDTTTGARSVSTLPSGSSVQAGLTSGPDGNVWFGMNGAGQVGRVNTSGSFLTYFALNGEAVNSLKNDGSVVWYTARNNSGNTGVIGSFAPNGTQTQYSAPTAVAPNGLVVSPDGDLWFTAGTKIGKMTTSGVFTIYDVPSGDSVSRLAWGKDGYLWATMSTKNKLVRMATDGTTTYYTLPYNERASDIMAGRDGSIWVVMKNSHALVKVGTGYTDNDEDGLTAEQEQAQGTSDSNPDTDGDGLTDYVESTSYVFRGTAFCNNEQTTCEYPSPTAKDIYIENDWMKKSAIEGEYSMQLNYGQVSALKTAFLAKGINLHIDTGQLDGGNEIPYNEQINFNSTPGQIDFYDYKNGGDGLDANFDYSHIGIYHYLITGQSYTESPTSSGVSRPGDDDLFVSYGALKDGGFTYSNFDDAISGSVMHELGHNLCLTPANSQPYYSGQPASCRFAGVDHADGNAYPSVMNYDKQLNLVDYSDGINVANDHNDWGTIRLGDFAYSAAGDTTAGSRSNPTFRLSKPKRNDKNVHFIPGPAIGKMQQTQRR